MKVLAIIPARYNSSRFPGKPLIDIKGKSMIQRVYEQVCKSNMVQKVVVATDDSRIFNAVVSFGGEVMMTANTHESGTERCGEIIEKYTGFDVVINIQGDEPLVQPQQIEQVLNLFEDPSVNIGTLVKAFDQESELFNPNRVKVVLDQFKNAIYFSRSPIPYLANVAKENWLDKTTFWKHIGIYAWREKTLKQILKLPVCTLEKLESLEQLRWLNADLKIRTAETNIETPNIDTPEDLQKVLNRL
ncbi:3-deoxy-manno-octulosonate cytidylyltransferase [Putridiphycobacter roseus]|uniref:3-deoxy-manno-octulosonate cytidylyltransferase n=1 Tax=Putridiphycobacter roseus TaxID=2219161 RepID=A0A2W1N2J8_9FLAO|nr:3-deoxy-manno-octulosonate cytidylyltransferase [Putridiphycobacter roseus]PZE18899.1 3-deoxy-manno-octulosonate cytidylyltransferase [Putridiphycobacter roseus]